MWRLHPCLGWARDAKGCATAIAERAAIFQKPKGPRLGLDQGMYQHTYTNARRAARTQHLRAILAAAPDLAPHYHASAARSAGVIGAGLAPPEFTLRRTRPSSGRLS
eukprot:scaffold20211_cov129-Isochrysis_galbana.AAC.2